MAVADLPIVVVVRPDAEGHCFILDEGRRHLDAMRIQDFDKAVSPRVLARSSRARLAPLLAYQDRADLVRNE